MSVNPEILISEFRGAFGRRPTVVSNAPGRVNLIGEHTDYNGGLVLPVAIDRTVAVAAAPRQDSILRIRALNFEQCDEFPVDAVRRFMGSRGWRDYPRGVVWALQEANIPLRGADLAVAGDVPPGAGLSSSAAIELAVAGALTAIANVELEPYRLAQLCQKAENLFVGVRCGIMDEYASALGQPNAALLIDCETLEWASIPLPFGLAIVVVDSKVPRTLGETNYNRRREECGKAAAILGLRSLRYASLQSLARHRVALGELLYRRACHVVTENNRVLRTAEVLRMGDTNLLGDLMAESHESLRVDFEVSIPELDILVRLASQSQGVMGSRLTGAGFGGCTVNLVAEGDVAAVVPHIVERYHAETGITAEVHVCSAVDGLRVSRV
jgi:galactokinase